LPKLASGCRVNTLAATASILSSAICSNSKESKPFTVNDGKPYASIAYAHKKEPFVDKLQEKAKLPVRLNLTYCHDVSTARDFLISVVVIFDYCV
jgi:hypothetical protein